MIKVGPNELVAIGSDKDGVKVWPLSVERVMVSPAHVALTGRVLDERGAPVAGALVERGPNRYTADDWLEHETELDHWVLETPVTVGSPELGYRSTRKENGYPTVQTDGQGDFRQSVQLRLKPRVTPQSIHILEPEARQQDWKPGRLVKGSG